MREYNMRKMRGSNVVHTARCLDIEGRSSKVIEAKAMEIVGPFEVER